MNSKIKSASIVLTGGVLLGFGSSVTLASNVIGTGYYGTQTSPAAAGDNASDIVMWDDANGYLSLGYGNDDGLSVHNGNAGTVVAIEIMNGGSGYDWNGAGEDGDVDSSDTTGVGCEFRYFTDTNGGVEGAVTSNLVDIVNGGYGYQSNHNGGSAATSYIIGWTTTSLPACLTDPEGGDYAAADTWANLDATWPADAPDIAGFNTTQDLGCDAYTATGGAVGQICYIDSIDEGYGYGISLSLTGKIYVNGVAEGDFEIDSQADGTLDNTTFDILVQTTNAHDPDDVEFIIDDATGAGFACNGTEVWGQVVDVTDEWADGDCSNILPTVASFTVAYNTTLLCSDCTGTPASGAGLVLEFSDYPIGSIDEIVIDSGGQNYDMAPLVTPLSTDPGTGAILNAVVGGTYFDMTYADGLRPDLANAAWRLYCGADYNDDGNSDLVAFDTLNGQVYIYNCGDQGMIEEQVYVSTAGADWSIAGQLDIEGAAGHGLCWYKEATGATAVWICNSGATGETPVLDPRTSLATSASSAWYMACTNDSQGGGNRSYWYNDTYGTNAWWSWDVDVDMPAADWVSGSDNFFDHEDNEINTGAYGGWMMEKVGCLSGQAESADDPNRDIVWANANSGAVCMWMCDDAHPGVVDSRDYCSVDGNTYNGGDYGISYGNRCVGIGQYDVGGTLYINPDASAGSGAAPDTHTATFGSVWWNNSGNVTCWKMDRTIDLEIWGITGETAESGSGVSLHPETVGEYQRY